jgi:hypothetical protein
VGGVMFYNNFKRLFLCLGGAFTNFLANTHKNAAGFVFFAKLRGNSVTTAS